MSEKGVVVLRQYEDFEYLSHCLSAHNDILSVVVCDSSLLVIL